MLKNIRDGLTGVEQLNNPSEKLTALSLFAKDFSYDSISDLVTRIISKELYDFTNHAIKKLNLENILYEWGDESEKHSLTFWDSEHHEMKNEMINKGLFLDGIQVILVPLEVVEEKKFKQNPDNYIRHVIAPRYMNDKETKQDTIERLIKQAGGKKELIQKDMVGFPDEFSSYFDL